MKHLCYVKIFIVYSLFISSLFGSLESKSAVVYHGGNISYSLLGIHDYIILQPDHVNTNSHGFKLYSDDIYAYISVGEIERGQSYYNSIDKKWIIGKNKIWDAAVMDVSNQEYQDFLFDTIIEPLRKKGFKNFFLDTLDSYNIATQKKENKEKMRQGLISFIHLFHQRYPKSKLIINRGFDIIDDIHMDIEAVLFESYYHGLSQKNLEYKEVSKSDRVWLDINIEKIKSYNKPIIAVDYLPQNKKALIKDTIKKIELKGMIPYIADRHLQRFGDSSKIAVKREVLLLYDDTQFDGSSNDDLIYSTAFMQLSLPLEYLGYIPVIKPISTWQISSRDKDRYAGAIVWINGKYASKFSKKFEKKIHALYKVGIKMLLLESIDYDKHTTLFDILKISTKEYSDKSNKNGELLYDNNYIGFEIDPFISSSSKLYKPKNSKPLCRILMGDKESTIAAITPWGGYVFEGALITDINKHSLWIVNPFKVIQDALRLSVLPVPDVTTENGRRLLFSHIDGDGIMNYSEWNSKLFSAEVLYTDIFKRYKIPISISIVEAETAKYGLYPKLSEKLEKILRDIFLLDHVEPATHTYTHPFYWGKIINDDLDPQYRLDIENYDFSLDREIRGSLNYINSNLKAKKSANTTFWSGDCLPTEKTLAYMYKNNFLQINGGDTTITNNTPWLSYVAPLAVKRGDYYQIFTGAQNENVYTNDWLGPFWGFKRVIQTFKLTNKPKRLKPIDIYYHMYSGSKRASLNALHTVYKWAMKQDVMPIYTSRYIPKVMDYYEVSMARDKNRWLIKGMDTLKTLRLTDTQYVDFNKSKGIVGIKKHEKSHYIHLSQQKKYLLEIVSDKKNQNYLIDANAALVAFEKSKDTQLFHFKGEVPVEARFSVLESCYLNSYPKPNSQIRIENIVTLSYEIQKDINVTISCR